MNLRLKLLDKSEIPLFNRSEEEAFSVHDKYFSDGIEPGAEYDDREEHDLNTIIDDPMFTVLAIYDGDTFVGGAIVEEKGEYEKGYLNFLPYYRIPEQGHWENST